jgi:hypothetical protein
MEKYDSLSSYLSKQSNDRVSLDFRELENILAFRLPYQAYNNREWWEGRAGAAEKAAQKRLCRGQGNYSVTAADQ